MQKKNNLSLIPIKKISAWSHAGLHIVTDVFSDPSKQYIAVTCLSGHVLIYKIYFWTLVREIKVFEDEEAVLRVEWSPNSQSIFCIGKRGAFAWVDLSIDISFTMPLFIQYPLRIYSAIPNYEQMKSFPKNIYPIPSVIDEGNPDLMKSIMKNEEKYICKYSRVYKKDRTRERKEYFKRRSRKISNTNRDVNNSDEENEYMDCDHDKLRKNESCNSDMDCNLRDKFNGEDKEDYRSNNNEGNNESNNQRGKHSKKNTMAYVNKNKQAIKSYEEQCKNVFIIRKTNQDPHSHACNIDSDVHFVNENEVIALCSTMNPEFKTRYIHVIRENTEEKKPTDNNIENKEKTDSSGENKEKNDNNGGDDGSVSQDGSDSYGITKLNDDSHDGGDKWSNVESFNRKYKTSGVVKDIPLPSTLHGDVTCLIKRFDNYNKDPNVYHILLNCETHIVSYEVDIKKEIMNVVGMWNIPNEVHRGKYSLVKGNFTSPITLISEKFIIYISDYTNISFRERRFDKDKDKEFLSFVKKSDYSAGNDPEKSLEKVQKIEKNVNGRRTKSPSQSSPSLVTKMIPNILEKHAEYKINGQNTPFNFISFSSGGEYIVGTANKKIQIYDSSLGLAKTCSSNNDSFLSSLMLEETPFNNKVLYNNYERSESSTVKDRYPPMLFVTRQSKSSVIVYSQNIPQLYSGLIKDFQEIKECKSMIEREDEHDCDPDKTLYSEEMFKKSKIFIKNVGSGFDDLRMRILERVEGQNYYSSPPPNTIVNGPICPFNDIKDVKVSNNSPYENEDDEKRIWEETNGNFNILTALPSQYRPPMPPEYKKGSSYK